VAPVPGGDAINVDRGRAIERAREDAASASGLTYHVFVGPSGDDARAAARAMHKTLPDHATAVLVLVDPTARALEIVTGSEAHRVLDDATCALVALSMQSSFAAGDLAAGIVHGLHQLGEHARRPESLHTD
jgi:hypothetical protein